eukprot:8583612-Ditylum_brightwellii.AAC.1
MGESKQAIIVNRGRTSGQSDDPSILRLQAIARLTIKELRDANIQLAKYLAGLKKGKANPRRKDVQLPKKNNTEKKENSHNCYP